MGKVLKIKKYRLRQFIPVLFLVSFYPSLTVYAEEDIPVLEVVPIVEAAPALEPEPLPAPIVEPEPVIESIPAVEPTPVVEPIVEPIVEVAPVVELMPVVVEPAPVEAPAVESKEILDQTFSNPIVEEKESSVQQDPDTIFSDVQIDIAPAIDLSKKKDELNILDEVFANVDIKKEEVKKEKVEALHSCAFDDFSIEIGSNEKISTPILLKKSGPNKKFGLKVGSVPEGIEITFSTNNKDFTSGESGSPSLAQKFSVLETKAVNKELIFTESVLEEKDPQFKAKKEIKIDEREVVPEEILITSSINSQKGSFNIPIIYAESNEAIGEENFDSNLTVETNCQFNLIVK